MRLMLVLCLMLTASGAIAQQFVQSARTSSRATPAVVEAMSVSLQYLRIEVACRGHLAPDQVNALEGAARAAFGAAGYQPEGVEAALREAGLVMADTKPWDAGYCARAFTDFGNISPVDLERVRGLAGG